MSELGWSVLRIAVASYVGLVLWMYFRQAHYIYFPSREVRLTPTTFRLPYEDIRVRTTDGETIHGWFMPHPQARGTVLFCHGNAGNIADRVDAIWRFHDFGLNVCVFDYRGFGLSSGAPTEEGTYRDAEAVWNWLTVTRSIPANRIVVFGESLGGAVAAWVAERQQPAALILESAFTSMPDAAARVYPFLPVRLLCRFRYDTLSRLPRIACPVLVAHSRDDDIIPFAQGERLFRAAREPKVFLAMQGSHNGGRDRTGKAYDDGVEGFVTRVLGPRAAEATAR